MAVRIAVSGERKSWLTARRIAVLIASLRRRASASTARRPSRSRSMATARSDARPGSSVRATSRSGSFSRKSRPTLRSPARSSCADSCPSGSPNRIELDPALRGPEDSGDLGGDVSKLVLDLARLEQSARHVGEQRRLASAALGLSLPATRARGKPADDDSRDEVDGERDPVLRVVELERVRRRQEEPVEGEHARDRDRQRVGQPEEHGDRQDGEDVEDAEAEDRRESARARRWRRSRARQQRSSSGCPPHGGRVRG